MQDLSLLADEHASHTHTGTDAHTDNANLLATALHLRQQSSQLAGTSSTERVTDSNGTTVGVNLSLVDAELANTVESLRSESLVDLPDANLGNLDINRLQELGDGDGGTDTHLIGGAAR